MTGYAGYAGYAGYENRDSRDNLWAGVFGIVVVETTRWVIPSVYTTPDKKRYKGEKYKPAADRRTENRMGEDAPEC